MGRSGGASGRTSRTISTSSTLCCSRGGHSSTVSRITGRSGRGQRATGRRARTGRARVRSTSGAGQPGKLTERVQATDARHGVEDKKRKNAESLSTGSSCSGNGKVNLQQTATKQERTQRQPGLGNHDRRMVIRVGPRQTHSSCRNGAERLRHPQRGADRLCTPANKIEKATPKERANKGTAFAKTVGTDTCEGTDWTNPRNYFVCGPGAADGERGTEKKSRRSEASSRATA